MALSNNIGGGSGSAIGSAISSVGGSGRTVIGFTGGSGLQRYGLGATINVDALSLSRVGELAGSRPLQGGQIGSNIGSYVGGILGNALNTPFSPIHGPGWNAQVGGGPGGPGNPQAAASPQSPSAPGIPGLTPQQNQQLMQALASKMLDQQKAGKEATKDGKVDTSKLDKRVVDEIKKYAEQFKEMKKDFIEQLGKAKIEAQDGPHNLNDEQKGSLLKIYDDFEKAQENLSPENADGSRNENFSPKSFIDATNNLEKWANDHPDKAKEMPELQKTLEKAGKIRDEIAKPMQSLAERNQGAALKTRDQLSKDVDKVAAKDSFKEVDTDDEKTKAYKSSAKALNEATKAHEKAPTKENETKLAEAKKAFVDNAKTAGKSEDKDAQSLMKASDLYEKTDKIAKQGKEITQDEADNTTKDIYKYLTEEHKDDGKKILKTISDGAADADALIKAEQEKAKEAADKAADDSVNSIDDSISIGE